MSAKAKKIIKTVVDVLLWIFLVVALLMTIVAFTAQAAAKDYPKVGNTCFMYVQTDSMAQPGGFYKGDLIVCRTVSDEEKENLADGTVISFYADLFGDGGKEINTHKIHSRGVDENDRVYYVTYGINNFATDGTYKVDDDVVYSTSVEAVWTGVRIPVLGGVINFLQSSLGFLLCIVLPLLAFFIYELVVLVMAISKYRNRDKKRITAEEEELIKQRAVEEYLAKHQQTPAPAVGEGENVQPTETDGTTGE